MTTEAGKRLLEAPSYHWQLCGLRLGEGECDCNLEEFIAAIEAEAVATERVRIAAAARGTLTDERVAEILRSAGVPLHGHEIAVDRQAAYVGAVVRTAVFAILEPKP
jgi:hypothetical protein